MQKIIAAIITFIVFTNLSFCIFADDEIEEMDLSQDDIEKILETATDLSHVPTINSRNAVVYDRTSRNSFIW